MTYLPGVLGEIADVAGEDVAIALADRVGGTEIWLPRRVADDHWLVETVGRDAATAICEHFLVRDSEGSEIGSLKLLIPKGPTGIIARARRRAMDELRAGATVTQAARRSGLHERTMWRLKSRLGDRRNSDQGELF